MFACHARIESGLNFCLSGFNYSFISAGLICVFFLSVESLGNTPDVLDLFIIFKRLVEGFLLGVWVGIVVL